MPRKNNEIINIADPNPEDRACDYLDKDADWPQEPSPILLRFKEKIKWVYQAGYDRGLPNGEVFLMINFNFGYLEREVPWGKMEEVRTWLINNWWRNFQILSPHYHKILMQTKNDYSDDFHQHENAISQEIEWWKK